MKKAFKKGILFLIIVFSIINIYVFINTKKYSFSINRYKLKIGNINIKDLYTDENQQKEKNKSETDINKGNYTVDKNSPDEKKKNSLDITGITKDIQEEKKKEEEKKKLEEESKKTKEKTAEELKNIVPNETKANLLNVKNQTKKDFLRYKNEYNNSMLFAITAYILNLVRIASIPIFIVILLVSYIYQYVLGIQKRQIWNKGYFLRRVAVVCFVATQVIPLLFALIVKGWGI